MVKFSMDFPADPVTEFRFYENTSQLSGALNGASIIDLKRTQIRDVLLLSSSFFGNLFKEASQGGVEGRSPEYEEPRDLRSNPFQGGGNDAILPCKGIG
ncbi:hypothetical protein D0Y65_034532 [Glycine soja]|uniref:Uncharacterized protein n=1 Tax=Glycine soja TaxID=3848 RepID=A0A445HQY5_GLYSO|nr:hypothetical protein D0Y65_034532 [Glycine soja]